jgi:NADH-quinone oxidoreductase subunit M
VAVINILYGAVVAMGQRDLKYVIAYSSVSHMGVVMLGIAALNRQALNGAVFQMFAHGIMTALFFALVGLVYEKSHTRDFSKLGGLARKMPGIVTAFTIGGLSSFGVPGTAGFVAELTTFIGTWRWCIPLAAAAIVGIVITATYVLRMLQIVFHGPMDEHYETVTDARTTEWVSLVVLGLVIILFGVLPSLMTDLINSGLTEILARIPI